MRNKRLKKWVLLGAFGVFCGVGTNTVYAEEVTPEEIKETENNQENHTSLKELNSSLPEGIEIENDSLVNDNEKSQVTESIEEDKKTIDKNDEQGNREVITQPNLNVNKNKKEDAVLSVQATPSNTNVNNNSAYAKIDTNYIYEIRLTKNKGFAIDVVNNQNTAGSNIHLYQVNQSAAQLFTFELGYSGKDQIYRIVHVSSGKILELANRRTSNNTNVQLGNRADTLTQWWYVRNLNGGIQFVNKADTTKVLDLSNAIVKNGQNIKLYSDIKGPGQIFTLEKKYSFLTAQEKEKMSNNPFIIRNVQERTNVLTRGAKLKLTTLSFEADQVMTLGGNNTDYIKANGLSSYGGAYTTVFSNIKIAKNNTGEMLIFDANMTGEVYTLNTTTKEVNKQRFVNSTIQRWYTQSFKTAYQMGSVPFETLDSLPRTVVLRSATNSNFVWDVAGYGYKNGANIQLYNYHGKPNQAFELRFNEFGFVTLTNISSGKAIDLTNWKQQNGANIQQYKDLGIANQKWVLVKSGSGYALRSALNPNFSIGFGSGKNINGNNIILWTNTNGNDQRFFITAYSFPQHNPNSTNIIRPLIHQPKKSSFKENYNTAMRVYLGIKNGYLYSFDSSLANNNKWNTFVSKVQNEMLNHFQNAETLIERIGSSNNTAVGIKNYKALSNYENALEIADGLVSVCGNNRSEMDVFNRITNWMKTYTKYSPKPESNYNYDPVKLISLRHGVCQAYAEYMDLAMKMYGINVKLVHWDLPKDRHSAGHVYNYIRLNNVWYYADWSYMCSRKNDPKSSWFNTNDFKQYKSIYNRRTIKDGTQTVTSQAIASEGVMTVGGVFGYFKNGKLQTNFTGIAKNEVDGQWIFFRNGKYEKYTGIAQSKANGKWYFVRNGMLDWKFTGVAQSVADKNWYYCKNGELDWNYTGGAKSIANGKWYAINKGKLNWNFSGRLRCTDGVFRVFKKGGA